VPKSKVRKKPTTAVRAAQPARTRSLSPSPSWYPIVVAVVLVLGLAYMVTYYLTNGGQQIGFMKGLGAWNFAIGFGVMLVGLVMAVRWR
jgi:hypothetical protein